MPSASLGLLTVWPLRLAPPAPAPAQPAQLQPGGVRNGKNQAVCDFTSYMKWNDKSKKMNIKSTQLPIFPEIIIYERYWNIFWCCQMSIFTRSSKLHLLQAGVHGSVSRTAHVQHSSFLGSFNVWFRFNGPFQKLPQQNNGRKGTFQKCWGKKHLKHVTSKLCYQTKIYKNRRFGCWFQGQILRAQPTLPVRHVAVAPSADGPQRPPPPAFAPPRGKIHGSLR